MATLEEILADVGLSEPSGQTKTASAQGTPSTKEVNSVLEGLGLSGVEDAGVTKIASDERNNMAFLDIYESVFGDTAPVDEVVEQTKVAAAAAPVVTETEIDENPNTTAFGELAGVYLSVAIDGLVEKLAGDLEMEAGTGHKPQASAPGGGQLSEITGKIGDPSIEMNYDASSGKPLVTNPGNQTPYPLKVGATAK